MAIWTGQLQSPSLPTAVEEVLTDGTEEGAPAALSNVTPMSHLSPYTHAHPSAVTAHVLPFGKQDILHLWAVPTCRKNSSRNEHSMGDLAEVLPAQLAPHFLFWGFKCKIFNSFTMEKDDGKQTCCIAIFFKFPKFEISWNVNIQFATSMENKELGFFFQVKSLHYPSLTFLGISKSWRIKKDHCCLFH